MFKEGKKRSFIKMISWRVWATITTMILVYIFTRKLEIAFTIGALEVVAKMILYYLHERVWNKIKLGRYHAKPFVVWFTGLPCSGKSTLADMTYDLIKSNGYKVEHLDGDTVRAIFPKTGFKKEDRDTHIKRIGFLASMLEKNGVIVTSSFVSPYQESREFVRGLCSNFIEVYVASSLEECEKRDVKGMYKKARTGEIANFTGVSDPYEEPLNPQIKVNTDKESPEESFERIKKYLAKYLD